MVNFALGPVMSSDLILEIGSQQTPYFRTPEFSKINLENERLMKELVFADEDVFVYKKICDYIEEIIDDDSFNQDFYYHNPIIDNMQYILRKIANNRIVPIFKNFLDNTKNNELKQVEEIDYEKINIIKRIVDGNFD